MKPPRGRVSRVDPAVAKPLLVRWIGIAEEPVAAATLGSLPELGGKLRGTEVCILLEGDVAAGNIFLWGTKGKPSFWNKSAEAVARERLLSLSAHEILTKAVLEKRAAGEAPKLSLSLVKSAHKALAGEGQLLEVPAVAGSKGRRVINAGHPEAFLVTEIAGLLERFGMPRSTERIRALLEMEAPDPVSGTAPHTLREGVAEVAAMILNAVNRIAFAPGTTVTFYRLRQQPELAGIPKEVFDEAALSLQRERRALLSIHDHAAALPKEEQDRFVTDGFGHFYVSIYAR